MKYSDKIKNELFNDKAFQAMLTGIKSEDREKFDNILKEMLQLADGAIGGFGARINNPSITDRDVEAAIGDRTGRK